MSENTPKPARKPPASAWKPGQSGNPKGRPLGSRNRATLAAQAMIDGKADALVEKALELALAGDVVMLRALLDRLCPPRKDSPITLPGLPAVEGGSDLPKLGIAIIKATTAGSITPNEAQNLMSLVETSGRILAFLVGEDDPGAGTDFSDPEAVDRRIKALREIEREREEFLPQRQEEVRQLKEELGKANKAFDGPDNL